MIQHTHAQGVALPFRWIGMVYGLIAGALTRAQGGLGWPSFLGDRGCLRACSSILPCWPGLLHDWPSLSWVTKWVHPSLVLLVACRLLNPHPSLAWDAAGRTHVHSRRLVAPAAGMWTNPSLPERVLPPSCTWGWLAPAVAYDGIGCNRDVLPLSSRREW